MLEKELDNIKAYEDQEKLGEMNPEEVDAIEYKEEDINDSKEDMDDISVNNRKKQKKINIMGKNVIKELNNLETKEIVQSQNKPSPLEKDLNEKIVGNFVIKEETEIRDEKLQNVKEEVMNLYDEKIEKVKNETIEEEKKQIPNMEAYKIVENYALKDIKENINTKKLKTNDLKSENKEIYSQEELGSVNEIVQSEDIEPENLLEKGYEKELKSSKSKENSIELEKEASSRSDNFPNKEEKNNKISFEDAYEEIDDYNDDDEDDEEDEEDEDDDEDDELQLDKKETEEKIKIENNKEELEKNDKNQENFAESSTKLKQTEYDQIKENSPKKLEIEQIKPVSEKDYEIILPKNRLDPLINVCSKSIEKIQPIITEENLKETDLLNEEIKLKESINEITTIKNDITASKTENPAQEFVSSGERVNNKYNYGKNYKNRKTEFKKKTIPFSKHVENQFNYNANNLDTTNHVVISQENKETVEKREKESDNDLIDFDEFIKENNQPNEIPIYKFQSEKPSTKIRLINPTFKKQTKYKQKLNRKSKKSPIDEDIADCFKIKEKDLEFEIDQYEDEIENEEEFPLEEDDQELDFKEEDVDESEIDEITEFSDERPSAGKNNKKKLKYKKKKITQILKNQIEKKEKKFKKTYQKKNKKSDMDYSDNREIPKEDIPKQIPAKPLKNTEKNIEKSDNINPITQEKNDQMQQFFQMMQMHQFHPQFQPNQNLFQNIGNQRFDMDPQNPFAFQPFSNNQFFNTQMPNTPNTAKLLSKSKADELKDRSSEKSDKHSKKEGSKADSKTKRKESFQENFGNPALFNQFNPINPSNIPNLNSMSHLAGLNSLNTLSMQNMGVLPSFQNIGGIGNSNLPNLANVPPQFNYYGGNPNFFGQNGFMQQPNEMEINKNPGNYNFMQMNNSLNATNPFAMQNKPTNINDKNRMVQNFNFFPQGFGMEHVNSQGEVTKTSEKGENPDDKSFEGVTSNQGRKDNFEGQKQYKE